MNTKIDNIWQWTNQYFDEGKLAFHYRHTLAACPYKIHTYEWSEWCAGYQHQMILEVGKVYEDND